MSTGKVDWDPDFQAPHPRARQVPGRFNGLWTACAVMSSITIALYFLVAGLIGMLMRGCESERPRPVGHHDVSFDISPRGDRIVFNGVGQGGFDLFLLDLATMKVSRIAETADYEHSPRFMPDGRSIVYSSGRLGDRSDQLFVRPIGGRARQLTSEVADHTYPIPSADGSAVYYLRHGQYTVGFKGASGWNSEGAMMAIDVDGTHMRRLREDTVTAGAFAVDPDERLVAYQWIYDLRLGSFEGDGEPVSLGPGVSRDPVFSPDGLTLVFGSATGLTVRGLVENKQREIDTGWNCTSPRFTPDGKSILFLSQRRDTSGARELWIVDFDGTYPRRMAVSRLFDDPLNWRANSRD